MLDDPIRVGPCSVCGDSYCQCPQPSSNSGADTDHSKAFVEAILERKPLITVRGARLAIAFDTPAKADKVHGLLWRAIDSVKPANTAKEV